MKRRSFITGSAAIIVAATITSSDSPSSTDDKVKNPLTIIKVGDENYKPSSQDLERWRDIFAENISLEDHPNMKRMPITTEVLEMEPDYHRVLLVRVGDESCKPSQQDLEAYREMFEIAADDKDFKIFTHSAIQIESIRFGSGGIIIDKS